MGFGLPSTFGVPVPMPTLDRLAQSGLRYSIFHATALCSPTRAALKSGRNQGEERFLDLQRTTIAGRQRLPAGKATLVFKSVEAEGESSRAEPRRGRP